LREILYRTFSHVWAFRPQLEGTQKRLAVHLTGQKPFTNKQYRYLLSVFHPDGAAPNDKLFILLKEKEGVLRTEEPKPRDPSRPQMPTMEEQMAYRARATAERSAKAREAHAKRKAQA
jgi:hypothetical protein